jgi:hypothetical protein
LKESRKLFWLLIALGILAAFAAGTGLIYRAEGTISTFTTIRGQTVELYGHGIYRYDTVFAGAGYRGTDLVVLCLGVPVLVILALLYRRGSLKASLLLIGTLAFFLYVYASMALGAAYNNLFLLYTAVFSLSFIGLVMTFRYSRLPAIPAHVFGSLPRRFPASLLFACGLVTVLVWLNPIISSMLSGEPPERLDSYTTLMTYALDLAVITPSTFVAGYLILRRFAFGYLMAFALFGTIIMLAPAIAASTVSQVRAGVEFTTGEMVGPVAGFVVLGVLAVWATLAILRRLPDRA